jgi:hypothetical protein
MVKFGKGKEKALVISVRISPSCYKNLKKIAKRERISLSLVIQKTLNSLLEKDRQEQIIVIE